MFLLIIKAGILLLGISE